MEDRLTPLQVEILDVVWNSGPLSATDIWRVIAARRRIARTTILTMISRLENRGWLTREAGEGKALYAATRGAEDFRRDAAASFVKEYFAGSPELLVKSLLGGSQLNDDEVARLRSVLTQELAKQVSSDGKASDAGSATK
ncbi:MAG TPA: BlaI/MecI/CopY family transcriptional regulator [Planctomycetota bacterium]|nr:BlaI/MecI/CopY family transcriptional regulator [Planctomycetota bacterium]